MIAAGRPAPLFILSFRHRNELRKVAEGAGWQPIAARRLDNAESRFVASGASVAVIDARGALADGHEAVGRIAGLVEANAAALLVLLSRGEAAALDRFHAEGATHFLVSPFTEQQFVQALRFAERHADRVAGSSRLRIEDPLARPPSWRWRRGSGTVELSPALARKAGLGAESGRRISLMDLFRRLDADGRKAARRAVDRLLRTGETSTFAHDDADAGGGRMAHAVSVGEDNEIVGRTEIIAGGSPQPRDTLTGLQGGQAARAWIERHLAANGPEPTLIMLLLAVSRFDTINAAFGRATGDSVLQAVARRIERLVEADGAKRMVARIAGAEFAVLLAAPATIGEGRFLAAQLVEAIGRPFMSGDHLVTLGSRVGVVASAAGDDTASLLRRASAILLEAKGADTGPIRVQDGDASGEAAFGDQLDVDLRRALDQDEIEILFQPQVAISSGDIVGAEALARWRHPRFGELGAITLFSVAERSDYLAQLSDHVQRKAITAAAAWPEALSSVGLSINITAADIGRPGFAAQLFETIDRSRLGRSRITVEMTEGGLIEDLNGAASLLATLREGGLRVAIDDFGTGYSSLAYLRALPLDCLKIDKRLSEDITGSPRDRVVVRGVIDMARSLGLTVIAEGVETERQRDLLAQEGCNLYQGFLCAPPVDADTLAQLVRRERAAEQMRV